MTWVQQAKVGDKILCIGSFMDAEGYPAIWDRKVPTCGHVYTIRSIAVDECGVFFLLDEIRNEVLHWEEYETDFHSDGFRPAQRRDTDISALTALLTTAPAKVPEAA